MSGNCVTKLRIAVEIPSLNCTAKLENRVNGTVNVCFKRIERVGNNQLSPGSTSKAFRETFVGKFALLVALRPDTYGFAATPTGAKLSTGIGSTPLTNTILLIRRYKFKIRIKDKLVQISHFLVFCRGYL